MNTESRLRAALQNTAELVEDRPRPLPSVRRRRSPLATFTPVWTAVAVTAVVITSFVIGDRHELRDAAPSSSPRAVSIGSAPKFYLAVFRATANRPSRFETLSTATGEVIEAHAAGNNENYVSAAVGPRTWVNGGNSFYLMTRVEASDSEGCGGYVLREIWISPEGKFLQWTGGNFEFQARDNEPMRLATGSAGDEIAHSYSDCRTGEVQVAHRWNGTLTSLGSDRPVTSLAYTPDGQSLIVGRETAYGKGGLQSKGELWTMKTRDPGFEPGKGQRLLANNKDIAQLYHATISSDGSQVIALFEPAGSAAPLSVAEFSFKTGRTTRILGSFDQQTIDLSQLSIDPDASGKNVLIQSGNKIVIMGSGYPTISRTLTGSDQPIDVTW